MGREKLVALAAIGIPRPRVRCARFRRVVALQRLQKFALEHQFPDHPIFGKLEKPRIGRRDRVPAAAETAAILERASPQFGLNLARPARIPSPRTRRRLTTVN
jgi:hypothetical protein